MTGAARIGIVGAGLSGLWAAFRLAQRGITDTVLFEARDGLGGRIVSRHEAGAPAAVGFDLGPAWFWPHLQPRLAQVIAELGVACLPQHEAGDVLWERAPTLVRRVPGGESLPAALRLQGGMAALTNALQARLPAARVLTGHRVHRLALPDRANDPLLLHAETPDGRVHPWAVEHALLALPPRLAASQLAFAPALPLTLSSAWRDTPTWMAPHAKYLAVYDTPFWRADGLSGSARSACGPLGEVHDASPVSGPGALFGFLAVPADVRRQVGEAALQAACQAHLVRLFGPQAAQPRCTFFKDWAADPFTATEADLRPSGHAPPPPAEADAGPWRGRVVGIGSEWSPAFPGYVAGAIDAADRGVARWTASP